jgi:hypothetical protein
MLQKSASPRPSGEGLPILCLITLQGRGKLPAKTGEFGDIPHFLHTTLHQNASGVAWPLLLV